MTLFEVVPGDDRIFTQVLQRYYDGKPDPRTLKLISKQLSQTD